MKTSPFLACAAAIFVIGLLLWRQHEMTGELASLRARLEALAPVTSEPLSGSAFAESLSQPSQNSSTPPAGVAPMHERLDDLERVADGQADALESIFEKLKGLEFGQRKANARPWNAEQVIGPPDSPAGDTQTAWAPATEDGGQEWLQVEFPKAVEVVQVMVRENCAPGAIFRIAAISEAGAETTLWEGVAPNVTAVSNTVFPTRGGIVADRVRIYLDTKKVPGWNEIDAVQLVGRDGSRQWASAATASSNYGTPPGMPINTEQGRFWFWTDDGNVEKLNITIGDPLYWDTPTPIR